MDRFQSTSATGRQPHTARQARPEAVASIHSRVREATRRRTWATSASRCNPLPQAGDKTPTSTEPFVASIYYSTPACKRQLSPLVATGCWKVFQSTPARGRQLAASPIYGVDPKFQSTPACGTQRDGPVNDELPLVVQTTPACERQLTLITPTQAQMFQYTPACGRQLHKQRDQVAFHAVSIHFRVREKTGVLITRIPPPGGVQSTPACGRQPSAARSSTYSTASFNPLPRAGDNHSCKRPAATPAGFNPLPRAGDNNCPSGPTCTPRCFIPLPPVGDNRPTGGWRSLPRSFNPLPPAGDNPMLIRRNQSWIVSIHSRLRETTQAPAAPRRDRICFNPLPPAGDNWGVKGRLAGRPGFNPLPPAGDNHGAARIIGRPAVSIHSRLRETTMTWPVSRPSTTGFNPLPPAGDNQAILELPRAGLVSIHSRLRETTARCKPIYLSTS